DARAIAVFGPAGAASGEGHEHKDPRSVVQDMAIKIVDPDNVDEHETLEEPIDTANRDLPSRRCETAGLPRSGALSPTQPPRRAETKIHGCRRPHDEDIGTRDGDSGRSEGQLRAVTFSFSPAAGAAASASAAVCTCASASEAASASAAAPCASGSSDSSSN